MIPMSPGRWLNPRRLGLAALLLALAMWTLPGLAQISVRSTAQAGVVSGNLVIPKPAGTATGDVLVAAISMIPGGGGRNVSTPAGWTLVSNAVSGAAPRMAVFTRVVPAADAGVSSYTFVFTGDAHSGAAGGITAFIGVDAAAPVNIQSANTATASGFSHTAPTVTTTANSAMLVSVFTMGRATADWTLPAAMTERVDVASTPTRPTNAGVALTMATEPRPTAGATGTRMATASPTGITAAAGRTLSLALRPAFVPANTHFQLDGAATSMTGAVGEIFDSGSTGLHGRRREITTPTTTNFVAPNPTIHGQHTAVSGQFCNATQFDGGAVLEVPDSPLFDYTTEFSASAWIFPTATPSELASVLSNDQNYELHLDSTRRLNWWWGGGDRSLTSSGQIPLNQWTHIAITFRSVSGSARQRIYINGIQDGNTNDWEGTLAPNSCNFYIGGDVGTALDCPLLPGRAFRGLIDEVKLYNYELTPVQVNTDRTNGRSCINATVRYRLEHDGSAHSCAAESITVLACANPDCSLLSNAGATGTVMAGGNSVPFSIPIGQSSTTVALLLPTTSGPPDPEAVRLNLGAVSPAAPMATSCRNGAGTVNETTACDVSVADAGLVVAVANHVSDTVQTATIQAVQRTAGAACVPLFSNVTRTVNFWSSYLNPSTGTLNVAVNGSAVGTAAPGTAFNLAFNANGEASISLRYPDAGAVRLFSRYTGSAATGDTGLVMDGQDDFIAKPRDFLLAVTGTGPGGAADATGPVFARAGVPFTATVTARNHNGATTPNFGRELVPESVRLESTLQAPAGGNNPVPVADPGFGTFVDGVATGQWRWDEVGVITLTPRLADGDYLGYGTPAQPAPGNNPDVVGTALANVGRFIPFSLSVTNNTPVLGHACAAGSFSYVGQEFGFATNPQLTVSGRNALGAVTGNYVNAGGAANAFWRFDGTLADRIHTNVATGTLATLSRTTTGSTALSEHTGPPFDGTGRVTINGDRLTYSKPTVPEAPFNALVSIRFSSASLRDSDGVCSHPPGLAGCSALGIPGFGGTTQRWGRIALTSAFGPELLDLQLPMRAEFFNGTAFVANPDDVCSVVRIAPLADANPADALLPAETCVQDTSSPGTSGQGCSVAGPLARRYTAIPPVGGGDQFVFWLRAPGAGNAGILDVTAIVPSFLQFNWRGTGMAAPTARVGFGVFQGDRRAIHTREVY